MPTCVPCPAGRSAGILGSLSCTACAPGSYVPWPAASIIYQAWNTTLRNAFSSTTCIPCPPGHRQPQPGQDQCEACYAGSYQGASEWPLLLPGLSREGCRPAVPGLLPLQGHS